MALSCPFQVKKRSPTVEESASCYLSHLGGLLSLDCNPLPALFGNHYLVIKSIKNEG